MEREIYRGIGIDMVEIKKSLSLTFLGIYIPVRLLK